MEYICEYYDPESGQVVLIDHFTEEIMEKANRTMEKKKRVFRWRFKLDDKGERVLSKSP